MGIRMSGVSRSSKPAETLRVAALQLALRAGEEEHNLNLVRERVEGLRGENPFDLLVLPECFNGMFDDEAKAVSRRAGRFLSELSRKLGVCIVGGSVERRAADGSVFNTSLVFDEGGSEVGRYDKRILFGQESRRRQAGKGPPGVFELRGWRVAVLICADFWPPELARQTCVAADLLCVPAETVVPTREHVVYARTVWFQMALVRAIEHAVPVAVSDWAETELRPGQSPLVADARRHHYTSGGSSIVDPSVRPDLGRMQHTLSDGGQGELVAALDLERVREFRAYRRSVGLLPAGMDSQRG